MEKIMAGGQDDDLYTDDRIHNKKRNDGTYDSNNDSHDTTARRDSRDTSTTTETTETTEDDSDDIGRAVTTSTYDYEQVMTATVSPPNPRISSSTARQRPRDSLGSPHLRSYSAFKNDTPTTPPSRRASLRSSRLSTPTTFVPSKKDRLRYSWQSISDDDEPGKPRIHVIKIVSTASTAAAGIGQEEAFGFSCSNRGKRIAVYNSARLFILQTAALPVNVSQEYALKRRPLAVEIIDDENILAVLADEHTVNVYDLSHQRVRRIRTLRPDHPTYTIALSSTGALLAAAYEGGIEIFSLAPDALSTDRRAIRCPRMDKLSFSDDASTLLGTTTRLHASSTVVVSVPIFPSADNGIPTHAELKDAWCAGLLNPENIRDSSHATFWRDRGHSCNDRLFAWDGLEDTFGILSTTDLEYGNVTCPIGVSQPLAAVGGLGAAIHSVPSVDESGSSIAMIVNHTTVRIYTVPQNVPQDEHRVEAHSLDHELNDEYGCPFADVRWVHTHKAFAPPAGPVQRTRGRLIVTSPGGMFDPEVAEQTVQDIEGGRIIIFDFDPQYAGQPGQMFTFTLGKAPPQELDEEDLDVAAEVDLVRRRTVTQNRNNTLGQRPPSLGRTATTMSRRREESLQEQTTSPHFGDSSSVQNTPIQEHAPTHLFSYNRGNRRPSLSLGSISSEASRSLPDLLEATELAYEEPYTQGAPRSGTSIQRAATNANRHRFQALEERAAEMADPEGGVPLPTYSEVPNQPLPAKYRKLAGLDIPQIPHYLYAPEAVTAPPVLPSDYYNRTYPSTTSSSSPPPTLPHPNFTRYIQRAYTEGSTGGVSPVGTGPPPSLTGTWEDTSPHATRLPGTNLRHQASWETVTTTQGTNLQSPTSQASYSPVSRMPTGTTLRSQPSFEARSPASQQGTGISLDQQLGISNTVVDQPTRRDNSSRSISSGSSHIPLDLGDSFRVSLLLPSEDIPSSVLPRDPRSPSLAPPIAAPADYPPSPSVNSANGSAVSERPAYYPSPTRPTPFQRTSGRVKAVPPLPTPGAAGVSAGSIPANWYPPSSSAAPPVSVTSSRAQSNSSLPPLPSPSSASNFSLPAVPPPRPSTAQSTQRPGTADSTASASLRSASVDYLRRPDPYVRAVSAPLTRPSTARTATTPSATSAHNLGLGIADGARLDVHTPFRGPSRLDSRFTVRAPATELPGVTPPVPPSGPAGKGAGRSAPLRPGMSGKRSKSVGGYSGLMFANRRRNKTAATTKEGVAAAGNEEERPKSKIELREEFREIEGQGKRCVVM